MEQEGGRGWGVVWRRPADGRSRGSEVESWRERACRWIRVSMCALVQERGDRNDGVKTIRARAHLQHETRQQHILPQIRVNGRGPIVIGAGRRCAEKTTARSLHQDCARDQYTYGCGLRGHNLRLTAQSISRDKDYTCQRKLLLLSTLSGPYMFNTRDSDCDSLPHCKATRLQGCELSIRIPTHSRAFCAPGGAARTRHCQTRSS